MVAEENGNRVFKIDDHIMCIASGLASDAIYLVDKMRKIG